MGKFLKSSWKEVGKVLHYTEFGISHTEVAGEEALLITIFVIHGNHEERPYNISSYKESLWNEGTVYYEE